MERDEIFFLFLSLLTGWRKAPVSFLPPHGTEELLPFIRPFFPLFFGGLNGGFFPLMLL